MGYSCHAWVRSKTGADIPYVVTMDILMHTQLSFAALTRAMMLGKSCHGGSLSNLPHTLPSLPDVALVADLYPCAALYDRRLPIIETFVCQYIS